MISCKKHDAIDLYTHIEDNIEDKDILIEFKRMDNPFGLSTKLAKTDAYKQIYLDPELRRKLFNFCDNHVSHRKYCSMFFAHSFHAYLNDNKINLDTIETHFLKLIEVDSLWGVKIDNEIKQLIKRNDEKMEIGVVFQMVFPIEYRNSGYKKFIIPNYTENIMSSSETVTITGKLLDKFYKNADKKMQDKFIKFQILESSDEEIFKKNDTISWTLSLYKKPIMILKE